MYNPYVFEDGAAPDWRSFDNGETLTDVSGASMPEGYGYMEGLNEYEVSASVRLRTLTVARNREGHPSQHIIAQRSLDGGTTWSDWSDVEPEGPPLSTYGSFFRHPRSGQVYYMYLRGPEEEMHYEKQATDFLDRATFLGWYDGEPFRCYPHLVGRVVFRYVSAEGEFSERYELALPQSAIDRATPFRGDYLVLYASPIPRRIEGDDGISWLTKHGPVPRCGNGEAFFVRYRNYLNDDRLENLELELFPDAERGITHPQYSNAGSFGPLYEDGADRCFFYRTVYGFMGLARTQDDGASWSTDVLRYSPGGKPVKCPQGPFRFMQAPEGRHFLVHYNTSQCGFDDFGGRDQVYISYMEINHGEITISEPELFHYRHDQLGAVSHSHERLNCPQLIAVGDRIEGRSSDKEALKRFAVPDAFLDKLADQFRLAQPPDDTPVLSGTDLPAEVAAPRLPMLNDGGGFTVAFSLESSDDTAKAIVIDGMHGGAGIRIETTTEGTLVFSMCDGRDTVSLRSNEGILLPGRTHHVAVVVDGHPALVSMVIDGEFQDGGAERERGTAWFSHHFGHVNSAERWRLAANRLGYLRVYDRFLLTTEIVGLQRALA